MTCVKWKFLVDKADKVREQKEIQAHWWGSGRRSLDFHVVAVLYLRQNFHQQPFLAQDSSS